MATTESTPAWRDLEARTKKVLSMETSPTPENIGKCNQQTQSLLFSVIPPEIRNNIFSLALLQYEDLTQPYPEHDYCYRPGHRARRIVSTELLLTCRRIWLEANHWPMEQAVHSFWFDSDRRPKWTEAVNSDVFRLKKFMEKFTPTQRLHVKHVQLSAQMYWLNRNLMWSEIWNYLGDRSLSLDTLTVTIRHSDWWFWESDAPLKLDTDWLHAALRKPAASRISEFRLELETLEWRMDQLRPILDSLKSLTICELDFSEDADWELVEPFDETTWSGPTNIGDEARDVYTKRDKLDYRIVTVKWRRRNHVVEGVERRWREEGSLLKLTESEPKEPDHRRSPYIMRNYDDFFESDDDEEEDEDDDDDDDEGDDGDEDGIHEDDRYE